MTGNDQPRTIAFFLPQFHPIPENDRWWGEGFTEWTNVRRARPSYEGHVHPRRPKGDHYFDLTDVDELRRQGTEAMAHGIDGFCVYFYWFDGHRLLERPLDLLAEMQGGPPYMLSWANENWSRRWDGRERELLMKQEFDDDTPEAIFADFLPHFQNPKYLTQDGRPMLMVHRTDLIPDPAKYAATWRRKAVEAGLPDLYLIAAETQAGVDPRVWGFDALAEFPPVTLGRLKNSIRRAPRRLDRRFRGRLLSYHRMMADAMSRRGTPFVLHRGIVPAWDNTARRGLSATVVVGHSPRDYHAWLRWALDQEREQRGDHGLVFLNAWNEWAEGAYLQPDETFGNLYLQATKAAVEGLPYDGPGPDPLLQNRRFLRGVTAGYGRALGNAAIASGLGFVRRVSRDLGFEK